MPLIKQNSLPCPLFYHTTCCDKDNLCIFADELMMSNMITIHIFDLLYKLWYRGCFYKNGKVRRSMLGGRNNRPRYEWVGRGSEPFDFDIACLWIMQFFIIVFILLKDFSGWSYTAVSCIGLPLIIFTIAIPFILSRLWKKKNWYFNEEKLKELNKGLVNEDLVWPMRVLCYLLYIIIGLPILLLPTIIFIGILIHIH